MLVKCADSRDITNHRCFRQGPNGPEYARLAMLACGARAPRTKPSHPFLAERGGNRIRPAPLNAANLE